MMRDQCRLCFISFNNWPPGLLRSFAENFHNCSAKPETQKQKTHLWYSMSLTEVTTCPLHIGKSFHGILEKWDEMFTSQSIVQVDGTSETEGWEYSMCIMRKYQVGLFEFWDTSAVI